VKKLTKAALPLIAVLLLTSLGVVLAATTFTLTASSNVTVNPGVVSGVFISGSVSNEVTGTTYVLPNGFKGESCSLGSSGSTLTCPAFSIQQGDYVVFTAVVANTGTTTAAIVVSATPSASGVLQIVADGSNPTWINPDQSGTFIFTLDGVGVGPGGFTVTLSGTAVVNDLSSPTVPSGLS
jgi:hypothetical protein